MWRDGARSMFLFFALVAALTVAVRYAAYVEETKKEMKK